MNSTSFKSKLDELLRQIDGAYAPNTLRAFRADFEEFIAFCKSKRAKALPASTEVLAEFIDMATKRNIASASIRRKIVSIGSVHRLLELPDPTKTGCVKLALRKMHRLLGRACKQAHPINRDTLTKMLKACDIQEPRRRLRALRNQVLLMVAYDTLARRSELVSLRFESIDDSCGNAGIHLTGSKVDQEGRGRWLQISQTTLRKIREWQVAIDQTTGPILRGVHEGGVTKSLGAGQVGRILKGLADRANIPGSLTKNISGHSLRVGAAQDWANRGVTLPQLMVLGGWEKPDTVIRYIGKARVKLESVCIEK
jgi:site-specific recombinase XerD